MIGPEPSTPGLMSLNLWPGAGGWHQHALALEQVPRPSDHPFLGGEGSAERAAREALEAAFSEELVEDVAGQDLFTTKGLGAKKGDLLFVVSGLVRVAHLYQRREEGWVRGRDPKVVDLRGPGCFIGVRDAVGLLDESLARVLPKATAVQYLSSPDIDRDSMRPELLYVRRLPCAMLAELVKEHPLLMSWLYRLHHVIRHADELRALLQRSDVLAGMGLPAMNAMLHCAAWTRVMAAQLRADTHEPPQPAAPFQSQGAPAHHVALLTRGEVELKTEGTADQPARVLGLLGPSSLIGGSLLYDEHDDDEVHYPVSAHAAEGADMLVWDRRQLQRIVRRSPASWHRLHTYADVSMVNESRGMARVTVVVAEQPGELSPVLALGLAMVLAREDSPAANTDRTVWIVELGDAEAFANALCVAPFELQRSSADLRRRLRHLPAHRELTALSEAMVLPDGRGVRVIVPETIGSVVTLVEQLRGLPAASDVIVHLPPTLAVQVGWTAEDAPRVRLHNPEAAARIGRDRNQLPTPPVVADPRLLVLETMRRVEHLVVLLNNDPDLWWRLTDEMPERWVRVDHLTPHFVGRLRYRTGFFNQGKEGASDTERDDRPGHTPTHTVRIVHDPKALEAAAFGGLRAAVRKGQTLPNRPPSDTIGEAVWRLARMVRGRSVGLALGGGGTWGAAHIGVIEEIHRAGIPVDYVAGTSFGALVGAIYASGGTAALRRFLSLSELPKQVSRRRGKQRPSNLRASLIFMREQAMGLRNPVFNGMWRTMFGDLRALGRIVERATEAPAVTGTGFDDSPVSLAELPLPYFPVASNLTRQEIHVPHWLERDTGLRAACSLPPIFPSMRLRGAAMADGAALANVPASVVRKRGADYVIAVNVIGAAKVRRHGTRNTYTHANLHIERIGDISIQPVEGARNMGLVGRLRQGLAVGWLALWKAGGDQARLWADALVDLRVEGVPMPATWRATDVAEEARDVLAAEDMGTVLREHWHAGGRHDDDCLVWRRTVDPYYVADS